MLTNYCVAATARGALSNGFEVVQASGARATYDEIEPASAISSRIEAELRTEGVEVRPAAQIGFD